jgi:hypothetical protein
MEHEQHLLHHRLKGWRTKQESVVPRQLLHVLEAPLYVSALTSPQILQHRRRSLLLVHQLLASANGMGKVLLPDITGKSTRIFAVLDQIVGFQPHEPAPTREAHLLDRDFL